MMLDVIVLLGILYDDDDGDEMTTLLYVVN